eukprot:TRINITY_DN17903_c0_g1_i1.p1 TRINITY_DN17903_c0_g1~~TRINITY_DN17903_c0_g1_i1.p1  ORF type:complete len:164 (+),score=28.33 TRINITY_DN17903_c0_g1_i1:49-492(+)
MWGDNNAKRTAASWDGVWKWRTWGFTEELGGDYHEECAHNSKLSDWFIVAAIIEGGLAAGSLRSVISVAKLHKSVWWAMAAYYAWYLYGNIIFWDLDDDCSQYRSHGIQWLLFSYATIGLLFATGLRFVPNNTAPPLSEDTPAHNPF